MRLKHRIFSKDFKQKILREHSSLGYLSPANYEMQYEQIDNKDRDKNEGVYAFGYALW